MGNMKKEKRERETKHETQRDVEVVTSHSGCISSWKRARRR